MFLILPPSLLPPPSLPPPCHQIRELSEEKPVFDFKRLLVYLSPPRLNCQGGTALEINSCSPPASSPRPISLPHHCCCTIDLPLPFLPPLLPLFASLLLLIFLPSVIPYRPVSCSRAFKCDIVCIIAACNYTLCDIEPVYMVVIYHSHYILSVDPIFFQIPA